MEKALLQAGFPLIHRERENGNVIEIANSAVVGRTSANRDVVGTRPPAQGASPDVGAEPGILLDSATTATGEETRLLLRPGALREGENLQYEEGGRSYLLLPAGVQAQGEDYETVRFRRMVREAGD